MQFLRVCDTMSERRDPQLILWTDDVFSADQVVVLQPAVRFAVPESVVASFSVRLLALALQQTRISRDRR